MTTIEKLLELDEFIYFLGYLWADGSVSVKSKSVTLSIQENDAKAILANFEKINNILQKPFKTSISIPKKEHWKTMMRFYSGDKELFNFLNNHDYSNKSKLPPLKILNYLESSKHNLFILGFFDGDGCIYNGEKSNKLYSISFSGPYDYDWGFLEKLFNEIKVPYKIHRHKRIKGANSCITTVGMFNVEKVYNFLYPKYNKIQSLIRKKEKFEQIIEHVKIQTSYEKGVCFCARTNKFLSYFNDNNTRLYLGSFKTEKEAIRVRKISLMIYNKFLKQFDIR